MKRYFLYYEYAVLYLLTIISIGSIWERSAIEDVEKADQSIKNLRPKEYRKLREIRLRLQWLYTGKGVVIECR